MILLVEWVSRFDIQRVKQWDGRTIYSKWNIIECLSFSRNDKILNYVEVIRLEL